jgi:hypothetical protein
MQVQALDEVGRGAELPRRRHLDAQPVGLAHALTPRGARFAVTRQHARLAISLPSGPVARDCGRGRVGR